MPPETRNEAKHNHIHERSFISKTALNFDRIFAEYAQPLKPEYLKGRWYAPEGIFLRLLQHFLHMLQFSSFIWPNSNLLKLLILVLQRAMRVQILHPSSLFHHMESIFHLLLRIFVKWFLLSNYHPDRGYNFPSRNTTHSVRTPSLIQCFPQKFTLILCFNCTLYLISLIPLLMISFLSQLSLKFFFNKHRICEWKEENCTPSAAE